MLRNVVSIVKIVLYGKPLRTLRKMRKQEMTPYPSTLPLDAASLVAEIVKNRQVQERKREFALAAWNVQGYIQKVTLGDNVLFGTPNSNSDTKDANLLTEVDDILMQIEKDLYDYQSGGISFSASNEEESISVVTVLAIISAVMQLIELWRNKRQPEIPDNDTGEFHPEALG